jgi:HTH-type transcriptional regulator/antitoxin HigA
MDPLPYKVIKSLKQYKEYCNILETLVTSSKKTKTHQDTIDLLTLLIEKWDEAHNTFSDANPVELLSYLMKENKLKATDLANELEVGKSLVSDILHYRRGLSRDIIRKLASRFKVSQELFNKPYKLVSPIKARITTTKKKLTKVV